MSGVGWIFEKWVGVGLGWERLGFEEGETDGWVFK